VGKSPDYLIKRGGPVGTKVDGAEEGNRWGGEKSDGVIFAPSEECPDCRGKRRGGGLKEKRKRAKRLLKIPSKRRDPAARRQF